jgi:hypothetical protein
MQRVKDWLIKKLGGYTRKEQAHYATFYVGRNMYLNDVVVTHMRQAREWEKRATEAETRVKEYEKLDARLSRMVHLRSEVRESTEALYRRKMPLEEQEAYIKHMLATQMAGSIVEKVCFTRMDDRKNMECVWACEAYLLKRED